MPGREEEGHAVSDTISPHQTSCSDHSAEDERFREILDRLMANFGSKQRICIAKEMVYDPLSGSIQREYRLMVPLLNLASASFISFEDALTFLLREA
jgi:hypothetical protein